MFKKFKKNKPFLIINELERLIIETIGFNEDGTSTFLLTVKIIYDNDSVFEKSQTVINYCPTEEQKEKLIKEACLELIDKKGREIANSYFNKWNSSWII